MHERSTLPPRASWLTTLGWACYLACSWTWCIGMFLPVLLVRDFGLWGFVVFAVPNVLGAAAMGWVMTPGRVERVRSEHADAVRVFSLVTFFFQLYFLGWVISCNGDIVQWVMLGAVVLALAINLGWARRLTARRMTVAAATLAFSACVGVVVLASSRSAFPQVSASRELLFLAPVCAFGFLLCPYLDATFLAAAAEQRAGPRRASFTLGFGVLFAGMILLTLIYSSFFLVAGTTPATLSGGTPLALAAVAAHLAVQLTFTMWVHQDQRPVLPGVGLGLLLGVVIVLARPVWSETPVGDDPGMVLGEVVYRLFMGCYGLVFPAYVWLCMIPTRDGHSGVAGRSGRHKLAIWAAAVALAVPAFDMGFIERRTWWLAPGLAVVLLARLLLPRRGGGSPIPAGLPSGPGGPGGRSKHGQ